MSAPGRPGAAPAVTEDGRATPGPAPDQPTCSGRSRGAADGPRISDDSRRIDQTHVPIDGAAGADVNEHQPTEPDDAIERDDAPERTP
jgi:hypothetical protein